MLILLPKFPVLDSPNSAEYARIMPNCAPLYRLNSQRRAGKMPKNAKLFLSTLKTAIFRGNAQNPDKMPRFPAWCRDFRFAYCAERNAGMCRDDRFAYCAERNAGIFRLTLAVGARGDCARAGQDQPPPHQLHGGVQSHHRGRGKRRYLLSAQLKCLVGLIPFPGSRNPPESTRIRTPTSALFK